VLLAASLALAGFLGLTGIALDRAFRNSAEFSVRDFLQTQLYGLLAAAELGPDDSLSMPRTLPEPRLSQTNSGLYARITRAGGETVWKSPSALGISLGRVASRPPPGQFRFQRGETEAGQPIFLFNYSVIWETGEGEELPFVFTVAEDFTLYQSRVNAFRRTLWTWLLVSAVVLVIVQLSVLMWLLKPLRHIAAEINRVERGDLDGLSTDYPVELRPLALNVNALLVNERNQRQRYRDKLDDLAHSLKTPLAVLRNLADRQEDGDSDMLREVADQVDRMQDIVSYQLRSAAGTRGEFSLARPVKPEIEKIVRSLKKAYHDRSFEIDLDLPETCSFRGDVGDFIEIVGNIMDNACKHCHGRVRVSARETDDSNELMITIDDDGPGIPETERARLLKRRVRGDSRTEGQGIGLAVVTDIAESYGGSLTIGDADMGGARVTVRLPGGMRA
jgi:two-component system sensor histidine kinase PhoQ